MYSHPELVEKQKEIMAPTWHGWVLFRNDGVHGYRVLSVAEPLNDARHSRILHVMGGKLTVIKADFKKKPKCGYCKRPHKLLALSPKVLQNQPENPMNIVRLPTWNQYKEMKNWGTP